MKKQRHMMNNFKAFLLMISMSFAHAYIAERQEINKSITAKGQLAPEFIKNIYMPIDGEIIPIAKYGHLTSKGDDIFIIENPDLNSQLHSFIQIHQQSMLEISIEDNHMNAQKELFAAKTISAKAYKESVLGYEKKQHKLHEDLYKLENMLSIYNLKLADLEPLSSMSSNEIKEYISNKIPKTLKAPISGYLIPLKQDENYNQPRRAKKDELLCFISDPRSFLIKVSVNEKQILNTKEGQKVSIEIPAIQKTHSGIISHTIPFPLKNSSKPKYQVVVQFDELTAEEAEKLTCGMEAIVSITTETKKELMIPISAVKTVAKKHYVMLTGKTHKVVEVELGATSGMNITVTSGLEEGDEILDNY